METQFKRLWRGLKIMFWAVIGLASAFLIIAGVAWLFAHDKIATLCGVGAVFIVLIAYGAGWVTEE